MFAVRLEYFNSQSNFWWVRRGGGRGWMNPMHFVPWHRFGLYEWPATQSWSHSCCVGGDGDGKHFDVNYFWPLGTMNLSGFLDIIYHGKRWTELKKSSQSLASYYLYVEEYVIKYFENTLLIYLCFQYYILQISFLPNESHGLELVGKNHSISGNAERVINRINYSYWELHL